MWYVMLCAVYVIWGEDKRGRSVNGLEWISKVVPSIGVSKLPSDQDGLSVFCGGA